MHVGVDSSHWVDYKNCNIKGILKNESLLNRAIISNRAPRLFSTLCSKKETHTGLEHREDE